ncbi:MAG: PBSX family phage terminase large subunit [Campylobacter sp.]|uniref:PBSX family phage terminase large subunit n=1 Tax=Campylobacter sp. TaxID=205 RepID=UPI001AFCEF5A|nr:PBSX family phage terminase large subunit [Campylobacter sp.]MBO5062893.1 PBSX family phage terminase large subunit [Campylobacter sp.]MBO5062922.1 PBSX family phage terminase large subunit [Campylobacter sp.]
MAIKLNISKGLFAPKFLPLLFDYSTRWEVYMGSAGSAKSYFITQKLILRATREKIKILVCRRTGATIRNTCFSLFKDIIAKWKLTPYIKIRESDFNIKFPNGSEVIFIGLDEETKLLSLNNIGCVFIEEAYEVPKSIVEQLNLRMRGTTPNQQIIMAFNPISKHHWLYDFCEVNPPSSFRYTHSTYKDNPFLNKEYIAELEELYTRNPQKARVFCDGEWGIDAEGLVFQNWKTQEFNHAEIDGELLVGLDFGFVNDISALVASVLDEKNKRIYIFKEWGARGKTNKDLVDVITRLGFNKSVIVADAAEPKSIEEIKRAGIQKIRACKKGADSIIHGIQKLQNYEIIVHPTCEGIIAEFENYTWQKDKYTDVYINKPIDDFNHYIDALRYSLQCVGTKLKTMDKNLF